MVKSLTAYRRAVANAVALGRKSTPFAWVSVLYARFFRGIGPFYYALFSLYRESPQTWGSYVLDAEANEKVRKRNTAEARELVTDKLRFYDWLQSGGLPTIPVLGIVGKPGFSSGTKGIDLFVSPELFSRGSSGFPDAIFLKTIDGSHGEGAFLATRSNDTWKFAGQEGTAAELFGYCMAQLGSRAGWLVQPRIQPCAAIEAEFAPKALGTVRIVTLLRGDTVHLLAALLKIPLGDSVADNFSEGSSGNMIAPIDLATGCLGSGVMSESRDWPQLTLVENHPESGRRISGFQLPFWQETVDLVRSAQSTLHEAATLGWDVALTDAGPLIVEANAGYGVEIHQVALQRGMRNDFSVAW